MVARVQLWLYRPDSRTLFRKILQQRGHNEFDKFAMSPLFSTQMVARTECDDRILGHMAAENGDLGRPRQVVTRVLFERHPLLENNASGFPAKCISVI